MGCLGFNQEVFAMTAYNEAAGITKKAIWNYHSAAVNGIN